MPNLVRGVAWEDLAVLLAALRYRSLNQAAQALRIGQSTASRRLQRLEDTLNARLFDRTAQGLLPTAFALALQPHAELIEGQMADVERLAAGQEATPRGRIRVALPDGLASEWLLPVLPDFIARYPEIDIDCVIGHAVVDLVRREADIAVRFIPPTAPDLVCRPLFTVALEAFVHPDLAQTPLAELRWVKLADPDGRFDESRWIRAQAPAARTFEMSLWNAVFAGVKAGLGAALISPFVAEQAGLVRPATPLPPGPAHTLFMVYHRALRDVPRIAVFRRWLVEHAATVVTAGPRPRA